MVAWRLQGDANHRPDPWPVSQAHIVGRVWCVLPRLGLSKEVSSIRRSGDESLGACGVLLPDSGRFCHQCGAKVEMPAPPPNHVACRARQAFPLRRTPTSPPSINLKNLGDWSIPPRRFSTQAPKPPLTAGRRVRVRPPVTPREKTAVPLPSSHGVPVDLQEKQWYYQKKGHGQPAGPVDEQQIRQWLAAELLQADPSGVDPGVAELDNHPGSRSGARWWRNSPCISPD